MRRHDESMLLGKSLGFSIRQSVGVGVRVYDEKNLERIPHIEVRLLCRVLETPDPTIK
jgi:hypothetical protein